MYVENLVYLVMYLFYQIINQDNVRHIANIKSIILPNSLKLLVKGINLKLNDLGIHFKT